MRAAAYLNNKRRHLLSFHQIELMSAVITTIAEDNSQKSARFVAGATVIVISVVIIIIIAVIIITIITVIDLRTIYLMLSLVASVIPPVMLRITSIIISIIMILSVCRYHTTQY